MILLPRCELPPVGHDVLSSRTSRRRRRASKDRPAGSVARLNASRLYFYGSVSFLSPPPISILSFSATLPPRKKSPLINRYFFFTFFFSVFFSFVLNYKKDRRGLGSIARRIFVSRVALSCHPTLYSIYTYR